MGGGIAATGAKALTTGKKLTESPGTLNAAQRLLALIGEEGKTAGVLEVDGALFPLVSGKSVLPNYAASGHVEGQAALLMQGMGATNGRLLIDNPNGICGYCTSQVPTLLPENAVLEVGTPLGTVTPSARWSASKPFIGNDREPKPWPR
ncbi:RHS repeat-associated core domain-containing protein [Streptomyces hirsutus]